MVPAGLNIAETMETGHIKNNGITQEPRMFCEESIGKVNAKDLELFRNRLVHEFSCLKVLMLLWNKWSRKKRILMSKTLINGADGEANWSDVVNFHCFTVFSAMTEMTCHVHHFFCSLVMMYLNLSNLGP